MHLQRAIISLLSLHSVSRRQIFSTCYCNTCPLVHWSSRTEIPFSSAEASFCILIFYTISITPILLCASNLLLPARYPSPLLICWWLPVLCLQQYLISISDFITKSKSMNVLSKNASKTYPWRTSVITFFSIFLMVASCPILFNQSQAYFPIFILTPLLGDTIAYALLN